MPETSPTVVPLLQARALLGVPGVRHGFTTRLGGVSRGALASLNLARREDEPESVLIENWSRVAASLHPAWSAANVAVLSQVHGARVLRVERPAGPLAVVGEADAAFTTQTDIVLAVRVADCVPVLLASRRGVAVAHAGWRGVAHNVAAVAVRALVEATGEAPGDVIAAVGPHISGPNFEVGGEVVDALVAAGLVADDIVVRRAGAKAYVDLRRAVASQLRSVGVEAVDHVSGCTIDDPRFYSHRRGHLGRMAGVIARCP